MAQNTAGDKMTENPSKTKPMRDRRLSPRDWSISDVPERQCPFATIAVLLDAPVMTAQHHRGAASANRSFCSRRNCARDCGGRLVNSSNASLV